MTTTHITSREFNQNTSEAKKATRNGPVIITDRGEPAHVLMSIDEYRKLIGGTAKLSDLLAMPNAESVELEIRRAPDLAKGADLE